MKGVAGAKGRAERLYRSAGFRAAYVRGAQAALEGGQPSACPYAGGAWSVAWRNAWLRGFQSVRSRS